MKNNMAFFKLTLMAPIIFTILGLTACGGSLEERTQSVSEDFESIEVVTNTADVTFLPSEDDECRIACREHKNVTHTAEVVGGILKIRVSDTRRWFAKLFSHQMNVTVYLPKAEYGALTVESDTGDLEIEDGFKFSDVSLSVDTGDMKIGAMTCDSFAAELDTGDISLNGVTSAEKITVTTDTGDTRLENCTASIISVTTDTGKAELESGEAKEIYLGTSTGNARISEASCTILAITVKTGDISLENVIAEGKFDIVSKTGDVKFSGCDAASVFITTDTGDVVGSFLTDKIIFADTDTGRVDIPKLTSGGKCEITTDTGDIKISITSD